MEHTLCSIKQMKKGEISDSEDTFGIETYTLPNCNYKCNANWRKSKRKTSQRKNTEWFASIIYANVKKQEIQPFVAATADERMN